MARRRLGGVKAGMNDTSMLRERRLAALRRLRAGQGAAMFDAFGACDELEDAESTNSSTRKRRFDYQLRTPVGLLDTGHGPER